MSTASWVIINKATGQAVFETFNRKIACAINRENYEAVAIEKYLASLNHRAA
jgi:hypothetical protein